MSQTNISETTRQCVREAAQDRCGYCLSPQRYVMGKLEVEHILPRLQGGSDAESNLWLSCSLCNRYKGFQTMGVDPSSGDTAPLFNPRTQIWNEHFSWDAQRTHISGSTPIRRAIVEALKLNNEVAVEVRRNWVMAGWHHPNQQND